MNMVGISPVGVLFLSAPVLGIAMGVILAARLARRQPIYQTVLALTMLGLLGAVLGLFAPAPRAWLGSNADSFAFLVWWFGGVVLTLVLGGAAISGGLGGAIRHRRAAFLLPAAAGVLAFATMYVATATPLIWPYARW